MLSQQTVQRCVFLMVTIYRLENVPLEMDTEEILDANWETCHYQKIHDDDVVTSFAKL